MDAAAAREFISQHHHAILATRRRDGTPQMSPIVVAVDAQGQLTVSSRESAIKVLNLRRNPRFDLVVFTNNFFGPWISIRGTAQLESLPEALPGLVEYYRDVSGEHPDWDQYRTAMVQEQRVLLRLSIEEVGPKVSG
ncbi:MAG TPA: PPOX class F420-dependent oxidoreductase [Candidatus Micrarchaeaceae archaeon]|nr:PPOX class F420-dependent oxidoreductase [Candidatus Micrarchaeaceae archaeon]